MGEKNSKLTGCKITEKFLSAKNYAPFVLNGEGRVEEWSASAEQMFGMSVAQVVGNPFSDLLLAGGFSDAPETRIPPTHLLEEARKALQKSEYFECLQESLNRKGEVFTLKLMVFQEEDGYSCVARDITLQQLKDVELSKLRVQAAQASRELEMILDSIPGPLVYKDRANTLLRVNQYFADACGVPKEELIGEVLSEVVSAEQLQEIVLQDEKVYQEGKALLNVEHYFQSRAGGRWLNTSKVPRLDDAGNVIGVIDVSMDITDQKRVRIERDQLFKLNQDMIAVGDLEGFFKQLNPAWSSALGWTEEELMMNPMFHFVHVEDIAATEHMLRELQSGKPTQGTQLRFKTKNGDYRWFSWNCAVDIKDKRIFAVVRDITDVKINLDHLESTSTVDQLTGIANRRSMELLLSKEIRRSRRNKTMLGMILVDIDFFKTYNETYGEIAGDDCLRKVARVMFEQSRRPGDSVCRWGGEEFICLLPETGADGVLHIAHQMRYAMNELNLEHAASPIAPFVTLSVGALSLECNEATDVQEAIIRLEEQMYRAKRGGRNKVCHPGCERNCRDCFLAAAELQQNPLHP